MSRKGAGAKNKIANRAKYKKSSTESQRKVNKFFASQGNYKPAKSISVKKAQKKG